MFQIDTFIEATLASVTNRVERHGEDEKPAVSLRLEITGSNTLLDLIDPMIRGALYKAVDDQEDLPGVEQSTPVLRCNSFEKHTLPTCYEGWTLAVDDGVDETDPMLFGGSKVDKFTIEAKQGGSIVLGLRVGTSDVDAEKLGKLAMHNGQSIWVTLKAPEKKAEAIDGSQAAFERDHPGADDATSLFANGDDSHEPPPQSLTHEPPGPDDQDDDGGPDGEGNSPDATSGEVNASAGKRTARGNAKTRKAIAEGLAAAGVQA